MKNVTLSVCLTVTGSKRACLALQRENTAWLWSLKSIQHGKDGTEAAKAASNTTKGLCHSISK